MQRTSTPASPDEFGIWYQNEAADASWRYLCLAEAQVLDPDELNVAEAADVLNEVLADHPEASARFRLDDEGTLIKDIDIPAARRAEVTCIPWGTDPETTAAYLRGVPISLSTGQVIGLAVQPDERGRAQRLFAVAHHIVWDLTSEQILWTAVDQLIATRRAERSPRPSLAERTRLSSPGDLSDQVHTPMSDPQHHTVINGGARLWEDLSVAAREHAVTRFAWVVGHLAVAVAEWSPHELVVAYIDLDRRPLLDPVPPGFGFYQSQQEISPIGRDASGQDAARVVHRSLGRLLAQMRSGEIRPRPERRVDDAQPCKFYLRDVRYRGQLRNLRPVDMPVSAARNQLQVGVTLSDQAIEVTVTAHAGAADTSGVRDLADHIERALSAASVPDKRRRHQPTTC